MNNDKLDMQSPNWVHKNTQAIAALFPNCVTETAEGIKIDFDLLKQELSTDLIEGNKERYRLEWPGKRKAIVTANLPTTKTLRPIREDSVNFDTTENLYIEGDNLEVLKLLQENYLGKIKMIYIDPPYNTGKDFVYKDNLSQKEQEYLIESGQKDELKVRYQANFETEGKYHSKWLSMMYPRLKLARNLLTDDGVIFISIDNNEVHNLKKITDELFGELNYRGSIVRSTGQTTGQDSGGLGSSFDYILVYTKDIDVDLGGLELTEKDLKRFENEDERGKYAYDQMRKTGSNDKRTDRPNMYYPIIDPDGKEVFPIAPAGYEGCWRFEKKTYEKNVKEKYIIWKKSKRGDNKIWWPYVKYYLEGRTKRPSPLWSDMDGNKKASRDLRDLMGAKIFDFPKPVEVLKRLLQIVPNNNEKDFYALDFFSGSSGLAHSVVDLNIKDGGERKFLMIQLPEITLENSEAYKQGYKNICEIGKERIRRAGKAIIEEQENKIKDLENKISTLAEKIKELQKGKLNIEDPKITALQEEKQAHRAEILKIQERIDNLDIGFRVYRLDSSNMKDVYYKPQEYTQNLLSKLEDNVKEGRTADDLLAQVMLDWGLPLSLPIEQATIAGKQVFKVAGNSLYACFDTGIEEAFAKAIAKEAPLRIVFKDIGFKDDTAKENVKQLLKQLSPETEMKVL